MTPRQIIMRQVKEIAERHGVAISELMGRDRRRRIMTARREAYCTVYERFNKSLSQTGAFFDRDPTTIWHFVKERRK